MPLDPDERRRIAKALWGYSALEQVEFAAAAGMERRRLKEAMNDRRASPPSTDELLAMADAVKAPRDFALEGWAGWHDADRVEALEQRMARVEAALHDDRDLESVREMVRDILDEKTPGDRREAS